MGNYIAYLRQSTTKQERSGLGIEAQRDIINSFIKEGVILAEYVETESGRKSDRPKLQEALTLCRKTNSILIVAKLDRLSRMWLSLQSYWKVTLKLYSVTFPKQID